MLQLRTTLGAALLAGAQLGAAQYSLTETYDQSNFFTTFDFFNAPDPTHGFVQYVNAQTANNNGLAGFALGASYLGVHHQAKTIAGGMPSTRVSSKKTYNGGLFITDIGHMPGGCGTWPAFWTTSEADWPTKGEIDIIEGVNDQSKNIVTLHSGPGCTISGSGSDSSSKVRATDCGAGGGFQGCGMDTETPYGDALNAIGGGIFAMEWTDQSISVWFFKHDAAPADLSSPTPDPATWGAPTTKFTGCDFASHFKEHKIIFDTTFCGDWAGNVWDQSPDCKAKAATCIEYVQNNPAAFADAYWLVNSIKVYQKGGAKKRDAEAEAEAAAEEKRGVPFKA
jgi:beta-glucanase (GH16 family)